MLNVIAHGAPTCVPTLLIAHGLFGSARNWGVIARRLSDRGRVVAADMRNHGNSPHHADHSYAAMAGDLLELARAEPAPVDLLGHSMGGKAAMAAALRDPSKVDRLIVADIAPVAYGHSQLPVLNAMRAVDLSAVKSRADADNQLERHIANPSLRAFLLQSLDLSEQAPRWRLNLEVLAHQMDRIIGFPDLAGRFDGPTLFLSGAESSYVLPEHRTNIRRLFPQARFARIPGAGHWLHAEKPREFESALRAFLAMD